MFGVVDSVGVFETLYITSTGLYFGRKINISKDTKEIGEGSGD